MLVGHSEGLTGPVGSVGWMSAISTQRGASTTTPVGREKRSRLPLTRTLSDLSRPHLQAAKAKFRIVVAPRPQPGPPRIIIHCGVVHGEFEGCGGVDGAHHWLARCRTTKVGQQIRRHRRFRDSLWLAYARLCQSASPFDLPCLTAPIFLP